MNTEYKLGTTGDRKLKVTKKDDEIVIVIQHNTDKMKKVEFPSIRLV